MHEPVSITGLKNFSVKSSKMYEHNTSLVVTLLDFNTQELPSINTYFSHLYMNTFKSSFRILNVRYVLKHVTNIREISINIRYAKVYHKYQNAALKQTLNHTIIVISNSENPTLRVRITTKSTGI